ATGLYLQPAGDWTANRETAKEFLTAAIAYWWAIEQKLLGTEVLLTLANPQKDFVAMKVRKGADLRTVIDCQEKVWRHLVHANLFEGFEVDLINFDYELCGEYCESMAQEFRMWFRIDPDPGLKSARFRRKHGSWSPPPIPS